jgi:hypothetical protein
MGTHLTDEMLMEALEGLGSPEARRHLDDCPECSGRLAHAGAGLELTRDAEVPEPPPLYWEVFRRQVSRRISEEAPARRALGFWLFPALAAAAAVLIAFGLFRAPGVTNGREAAVVTLPAWTALPPAEEDEGLEVLQAVAAEGGALDAALPAPSVDRALSDLSDEESQVLADALRRELAGADAL